MKHTKLLPILSTCLIATTCPIVTSCNNTEFDGKVTTEEISKAIDELTDCNSWNVTTDCSLTYYDTEGTYINAVNLLYKFTPNGVYFLQRNMSIEGWAKKHENEWFSIYQNNTTTFIADAQLGNHPLNFSFLIFYQFLKQSKSNIMKKSIFNIEHKGYYYLDTTNKQIWYFKFNSNKKIDYFFYEYFDEDYQQYCSFEFKNDNYGSTTIEYPFKDEDIDYPAKAKLEYDSTNVCYASESSNNLRYGCTFTANSNLLKPTKLQILNGVTPLEYEITDVSIYLNDKKVDCTYSWDSTNNLCIINGLEFKENDAVVLIWNWDKLISKTAPKYTIKLS